jgi:hypothetical protein
MFSLLYIDVQGFYLHCRYVYVCAHNLWFYIYDTAYTPGLIEFDFKVFENMVEIDFQSVFRLEIH